MKDIENIKQNAGKLYQVYEKDVCAFAEDFCDDVVNSEVPEFHREIYNLLYREDRLVLIAPRGFAKSTLAAKIYPLWAALFKKRRDICIISASENLAVDHMRYIKISIEANPYIKAFFGDLVSNKWTETHMILRHPDGDMINIRAKGAGGQIRGFRPDLIVLDDIETDESVESEEQRKKLKNWLFKACINTMLPGGQLVVAGTLIHYLSVLADLYNTPNRWSKKKYTAYVDGVADKGHELWPEQRPHGWLQARKSEIGSNAFAAEFMNDPRADEAAPIKEEYLRYWENLPNQISYAIAVDPAYSEDPKSDYKVAVLVGIDENHNRYLVEYIRTHCPTGEFQDAILNMYERNKGMVTSLGVPRSGGDREFYSSLIGRAEERNIYPPFVELKNTYVTSTGAKVRNKEARIAASLQGLFEKGKYYIHENHFEARDELLSIGSSRWDDLVDAMSYAEQVLQPVFFKESGDIEESNRYEYAGSYGIDY